jgi:hypothetical protein
MSWWRDIVDWFRNAGVPDGIRDQQTSTKYFEVVHPEGIDKKDLARLDLIFERMCSALGMTHTIGSWIVHNRAIQFTLMGYEAMRYTFGVFPKTQRMFGMTAPLQDGHSKIYLCDLSERYVMHELAHAIVFASRAAPFGYSPALHEAMAKGIIDLVAHGSPSPTWTDLRKDSL